MSYKVRFDKRALKEWERLDSSIRKVFAKHIIKRQETPHVPQAKLRGMPNCYKIKLKASGFRLVYEVIDNEMVIIVIAVGKREDNEVYASAKNRLV